MLWIILSHFPILFNVIVKWIGTFTHNYTPVSTFSFYIIVLPGTQYIQTTNADAGEVVASNNQRSLLNFLIVVYVISLQDNCVTDH